VYAGQPTLDHLPQVQQQVPAVRDLHGPRRPEPDAAGVLGRAVAGDGPDPAMAPEPVGQRRGAPVRQQVDHAMPLQVDEDGPVRSSGPCGGPSRRRRAREEPGVAAKAGGGPGAEPCRRSPACRAAAACARPPRHKGKRQHDPARSPAGPCAAPAARSGQAAARRGFAEGTPDCGSTGVQPRVLGEPRGQGRANRLGGARSGCGQHRSTHGSQGTGRSAAALQHGCEASRHPRA